MAAKQSKNRPRNASIATNGSQFSFLSFFLASTTTGSDWLLLLELLRLELELLCLDEEQLKDELKLCEFDELLDWCRGLDDDDEEENTTKFCPLEEELDEERTTFIGTDELLSGKGSNVLLPPLLLLLYLGNVHLVLPTFSV